MKRIIAIVLLIISIFAICFVYIDTKKVSFNRVLRGSNIKLIYVDFISAADGKHIDNDRISDKKKEEIYNCLCKTSYRGVIDNYLLKKENNDHIYPSFIQMSFGGDDHYVYVVLSEDNSLVINTDNFTGNKIYYSANDNLYNDIYEIID